MVIYIRVTDNCNPVLGTGVRQDFVNRAGAEDALRKRKRVLKRPPCRRRSSLRSVTYKFPKLDSAEQPAPAV